MNRIVSVILAFAVLLCLCACGGGGEETPEQVQAEPVETAEAEPTPSVEDEVAAAVTSFNEAEYAEALSALTALEDEDIPTVKALIGRCLYLGLGTDIDYDKGVEYLTAAAESGSVCAKYLLADAAFYGTGAKRSMQDSAELYKDFVDAAAGVDRTDPEYGAVMAYLAHCHAYAAGTAKNEKAAADAADAAASDGRLTAIERVMLAQLYDSELMGTAKPTKAKLLYSKAFDEICTLADAGNIRAMKLLGDYYLAPKGDVEQDYAKALELFTEAAEYDLPEAQAQLGYMYQNGLGVEVDYEQAMEWNNRAAQQGNAQGQAQIGYMYHKGLGVSMNLDEAGRWYARAAAQGDPWAGERLKETEVNNPQAFFEAHG